MLITAKAEVEAADTMEDNPGLMNTLDIIQQRTGHFRRQVTRMANEAVKCFARYSSFPKLIGDAVTSELDDADDMLAVDTFTWTVVSVLSDLLSISPSSEELKEIIDKVLAP